MNGYILGVWDGHDSGAAVIKGNRVLVCINEERLTRRKLEIKFPENSIRTCLSFLNLSPEDISSVAVSTSDFAKTLARLKPSLKEDYYLIRRRKKGAGMLSSMKKRLKYRITEIGSSSVTEALSRRCINTSLRRIGFDDPDIALVDHHRCHAASAAFCSGFDDCLVITIDGIGDGLSATVSTLKHGRFVKVSSVSGRDSLGIFFEHVTTLMNMRELEDEGKVMALANYAYPVADEENPLLGFIDVIGMNIKSRYSSLRMFDELKKVLWKYPSEQFAYMAQKTLENKICEFVSNCVQQTGMHKIAFSGGVFSNIKVNMKIKALPDVEQCFVFSHMGDGGLALGAACSVNYDRNAIVSYEYDNIYWGVNYSDEQILSAIKSSGLNYDFHEDIELETARLISEGHIVFWFQSRMEYGPRSLGNRSILARPDSMKIRDILNLRLKMRVWYQPFCPSMLESEADNYLEHYDGLKNRFMTMGYMVKPERQEDMQGVISIDGSCRPQFVTSSEPVYEKLLKELKRLTGIGVVLNTSFNIHGEPMVCSPEDALRTLKKTGNEYLVMGNYLIKSIGERNEKTV